MKLKLLSFMLLGVLLFLTPVLAKDYEVSVSITPKELTVKPCGIATFDIDVENTGELEDTYSMTVEGIPEGWYTLSEDTVTVKPDTTERVYLFVTPYCLEEKFDHYKASISAIGKSNATENFTLIVIPDHVIEVSIPSLISACLGEETNVDVIVKNRGNHSEDIALTVSGDASNFVELIEESLILGIGEEKNVTLKISPIDVEIGSYGLKIEVASKTSYARASASTVIDLTKCYQVDVTYPERISACTGKVPFNLTVRNVGIKSDSYVVKIEELNYTETIYLEPGMSKTLQIEYIAVEEGTYDIEFVVESEFGFAKKEGTIKFIIQRCYGVDLSVEEKEFEIESGRGKLVKGLVKNIGLMADKFKVVSDVVWVSIRPEEVSLPSNESGNIYAYYSPEYGAKGDYYTNLTVKSNFSEDTEGLKITVKPKVEEVTTTTIEEVPPVENVTTTIEETTTTTLNITVEENVTTTIGVEIPTGEAVGVLESLWGNKVVRSLLIAIIVVVIILIIIYLIVMR